MDEEKNVASDDLAVTIGKNVMRLRKMAKMTQLDLAEKLNYSDKSISKWEQGNGIPDMRIMVQLAELFNVTVDDLVHDHKDKPIYTKRSRLIRRLIIVACSVGLCWLVATVCFALFGIFIPSWSPNLWLAFLYAVPVSAIVTLVFACIWHYRIARFISITVLIWTVLACIFLTAYILGENIWLIFLIGVPLQFLAIFFFAWWKGVRSAKEDKEE